MGERSTSQTPRLVDSAIAPAGASTNAAIRAAATSKIPFRPRKIRRISSSAPEMTNDSPKKTLAVRVIPRPLSSEGEVSVSISHLRAVDPLLSAVIDAHDPPTFQCLISPFHSLARSILYQQLAVKAASSIYGRFVALCGGEASVVPDVILSLTTQQLRQIGVSERKASYLHDLSRKYHGGILSDASIVAMDDKSLFSMLTMVKGIGAWSVHMFMMFCLHRPDVLPVGDLGVRKGVQILYGLDEVPRPSQMEQLCDRWRPYRSVGSWYMWRVVETKNNSNLASPNAGALTMSTVALADVQQQEHKQTLQEQMVDSYQMLPQSWSKSISPTGGAHAAPSRSLDTVRDYAPTVAVISWL
ncbi:alkylbase DNA glycosidase-like protein mag2 [Zingiber officinale]|uniref:alkylbase DNA glycosidase-like protein mag2 n=1 Tax=Zingiber officinale TaxID=94328 RepID=UPI001C4CE44B|nr:alkylbase DNA glycosidase-like protein mag2 [Zingiber officinale]